MIRLDELKTVATLSGRYYKIYCHNRGSIRFDGEFFLYINNYCGRAVKLRVEDYPCLTVVSTENDSRRDVYLWHNDYASLYNFYVNFTKPYPTLDGSRTNRKCAVNATQMLIDTIANKTSHANR